MRRPQAERGQAVLETALGAVAFVGAFLLMLYLFELGQNALKVQESAHFAAWDLTGRSLRKSPDEFVARLELKKPDLVTATAMAELSANRAASRYADLDGRQSTFGAQAMGGETRTRDLQFVAEVIDTPFQEPLACKMNWVAAPNVIDRGTKVIVAAEATVDMVGLAKSVIGGETRGLQFSEAQATTTRKVCGFGRKLDGECKGRLYLVVDDWSVHSPDECALADEDRCKNREYYRAVENVYDTYTKPGSAASDLAIAVAGSSPIDEGKFWFSFRDGSSGFFETSGPPGEGRTMWKTGPGMALRKECFLGLPCRR